VWTDSNRTGPIEGMLGTALLLRDNGTAARVTIRADEGDDICEVFTSHIPDAGDMT